MPIYEYRCAKCGTFEALESIHDVRESTPCIVCGQIATKIISRQGLQPFKAYYTEAFKGFSPIRVDSREQERHLCNEAGFERVS